MKIINGKKEKVASRVKKLFPSEIAAKEKDKKTFADDRERTLSFHEKIDNREFAVEFTGRWSPGALKEAVRRITKELRFYKREMLREYERDNLPETKDIQNENVI